MQQELEIDVVTDLKGWLNENIPDHSYWGTYSIQLTNDKSETISEAKDLIENYYKKLETGNSLFPCSKRMIFAHEGDKKYLCLFFECYPLPSKEKH